MDYTFSQDFLVIFGLSAVCGALGGLTWDIGYSISGKRPRGGLENHLTLPHMDLDEGPPPRYKGSLDLGFFGPLILGAVAGILAVFVLGRSGPDAATILQQLSKATNVSTSSQDAKDALATGIDLSVLVPLAILGGFAGWGLLQTLSARLTSVAEKSKDDTRTAAIRNLQDAQPELGISTETLAKVTKVVASASSKTAEGLPSHVLAPFGPPADRPDARKIERKKPAGSQTATQ